MKSAPPPPPAPLFLLRLWADPGGDGQLTWCGRLQHVVSGEAANFADWPGLRALLRQLLAQRDPDPTADGVGRSVEPRSR